jgi:prepilin-type N-terminal cleavage/methylation domain-containing protein
MLTFRRYAGPLAPARGFSLIEMMVSIVIGLIVAAGAISLIFAINQSNVETIDSTRLTQELRTLATVIADDVKRTRRIDDPIGMIGQGAVNACAAAPVTPAQPCYPITPSAVSATPPSCITYGYTGTIASASVFNYHSIRLATTGGVGRVLLSQLSFDPGPDPAGVGKGVALPTTAVITHCDATGGITGGTETQISSSQINITALTFTYVNPGEIDLSLTGKLLASDTYSKTISRTFSQPIFIRSSAL